MARFKTYPDLFTHRRCSILPEEVQAAVREVGGAATSATGGTRQIGTYRAALSKLDPRIVAQASAEIREISRLNHRYRSDVPRQLLSGHQASDFGWLMQFHSNGFVRENAMKCLDDAPRSPFEFVAIVYRMNDWAVQVRRAAFEFAARYFPKTEPEVIGKAAFFLFQQMRLLGRWEPKVAKFVEDTLYDERALSFVVDRLLHIAESPVVRVLRAALQRSDLDPFLPELALNAKSSAIRSCAADILVNGRAQWANGYKRAWVNKVYGISRREPDLAQRPLTIAADIRAHMDTASKDKSAQVRRIAASYLAEHRDSPEPWHAEIAARLKNDKNPSVVSRVEFYFRRNTSVVT